MIMFKCTIRAWYWLNNIDNISSVVSLGRLVRNKILLGSSGKTTAGCCTAAGITVEQQMWNDVRNEFRTEKPEILSNVYMG